MSAQPGFKLTAAQQPEPTPRKCGTCRHYQPSRGPTGRIRPTQRGACAWTFPWPSVWPHSFVNSWRRDTPRRPIPDAVWAANGSTCPCWQEKAATRRSGEG
jgi:hypothetical protein